MQHERPELAAKTALAVHPVDHAPVAPIAQRLVGAEPHARDGARLTSGLRFDGEDLDVVEPGSDDAPRPMLGLELLGLAHPLLMQRVGDVRPRALRLSGLPARLQRVEGVAHRLLDLVELPPHLTG